MRFSLQKTAHAALSSATNRKSGFARDDKGEGGASNKSGCSTEGWDGNTTLPTGLSALATRSGWPIQAFFSSVGLSGVVADPTYPPDLPTASQGVITTVTPSASTTLPFVIPSIPTCLRQVEGEMTRRNFWGTRPGGPAAKRQPSPEGLGNRSDDDPSAVGRH
jgi:hypothetical protein